MKRTAFFKSEKWLNKENSPSTGSIVCYDGDVEYTEGVSPCVFIEIADCHQKVRLHMAHTDSMEEFIDKIDLMCNALKVFKNHLIYNSPHKPTERMKPSFYKIKPIDYESKIGAKDTES